jgi:cytochrome c
MVHKLSILGIALLTTATLSFAADAPAKGDAGKGKTAFQACTMCHAIDGTTKKMGPNLKGLFKHAKLKNGKQPNEENVLAVVKKGGNGMPSYGDMLSPQELTNLVAYLKTI